MSIPRKDMITDEALMCSTAHQVYQIHLCQAKLFLHAVIGRQLFV